MARIRRLTLAMLCTTAGGLLLCGTSAQAATRPYIGSFGPAGPSSGDFGNPQSIAVEQATGDVYVYDINSGGRVYKFNATGEPQDFSATGTNVIDGVGGGAEESEIAVDSSSGPDKGDIYVANGEEVLVYSSTGAKLSVFAEEEEPCGVAVDPSGNLYVRFYGENEINEYTPAANPVSEADYVSSLWKVREVCNIAVDSGGDVYTAEYGGGTVTMYEASQFNTEEEKAVGAVLEDEGEEAEGATLTVDPTSGIVYIDEESDVTEYEESGNWLGRFGKTGAGALSGSLGVAVNASSDEVYAVHERPGEVEIFSAPVVAPEVSTEAATGVTRTTATLNGSVNPEGLRVASCEFEYGTTNSYGHTIPCAQATPIEGSASVPVNANLTGLTAGTAYYYRLVVSTENGDDYYGSEKPLTTLPAVEGVDTDAASDVLATSATLNGSLEPNSFDTHYFFEYGENSQNTNYVSMTTREDAGALNGVKQVPVSVTGLEPNKGYIFRLVAENSFGTTTGEAKSFTTVAAKPTIHALPAEITSTTAGFSDTLNPENSTTKYHFEYGPTEAYGQNTPEATLASSFGEETVDGVVISELQPETTLYYRLIATNTAGTSEGPPQTLTTSPATPPTAITTGASNVSQNAATISGTISTNGLETDYGFEIGTEAGNYGPATGLGSLGGATTATVTMTLGELQPGTTYHYRVTATSLDGASYGTDQTFTTAGFPTLLTAPSAPPLIATPTIAFPTEVVTTGTTTKALTRAQKLAKALKACKQEKKKAKRSACEREARDKYAPAKAKKKSKKQKK